MTDPQLPNKELDLELAHRIHDHLKWDKRVSSADFDVEVENRGVIISGYVDTAFKKRAALEVVSDTEGVWSIEDRIMVPSEYFRSDDEIRTILSTQIAEMLKIGGEHIEIEVLDAIVVLHGQVFRPRLKAMAASAAWELSGVRDVQNLIEIRGEVPASLG